MRSFVLVAIILAGAVLAAVPAGSSNHCESRLSVYSRASLAPVPAPPYHQFDQNVCKVIALRGLEDHTLASNADQIMLRVNGAFGTSVQQVLVDLDGMGFQDAEFTLLRVVEPGGATYQLPEWIFVPDPAGAQLNATVHYQRESFTVTYVRNPVQLPLQPLPPAPEPPTV